MYKHQELRQKIIEAGHNVHNELGCGFLEKVYHNALVLELRKTRLGVAIKAAHKACNGAE